MLRDAARSIVRGLMPCLVFVLACTEWVPLAMASGGSVKRFAVVVGAQKDPREHGRGAASSGRLAYSDDDALAMFELLAAAGVQAVVLTQPDDETRELYPWHRKVPIGLPRHADVMRALRRMVSDALQAKRTSPDTRVEVIFAFSGHGSAGALVLDDAKPLTGMDLQSVLLEATSGAGAQPGLDAVHLLIDACGVASQEASREASSFADQLELENNTHAGIFLAMTGDGQTFEWDQIGAGLFSYQVRSGLLGGADLAEAGNGPSLLNRTAQPDLTVDYRELGAFTEAANLSVRGAARIYPMQRPARGDPDHALLTWDPAALGGSYYELAIPATEEVWLRVADATVSAEDPTQRSSHAAASWLRGSDDKAFTQERTKQPRRLYLAEIHLGKRYRRATKLRLPRRERYDVTFISPEGGKLDVREYVPSRDGASVDPFTLPVVTGRRGGVARALKEGLFLTRYDEQTLAFYQRRPLPGQPGIQLRDVDRVPAAGRDWVGPLVLCATTAGGAALTGLAYAASKESYADWKRAANEAEYGRLQRQTGKWDTITTIGLAATAAAGAGCAGTLIFSLLRPSERSNVALLPGGAAFSVRF